MRALLFILSFVYSAIFYIFYRLSENKDIFWEYFVNQNYLQNYSVLQIDTFFPIKNYFISISWWLFIESIWFLFLWIIFIYYFSFSSGSQKVESRQLDNFEETQDFQDLEFYEEKRKNIFKDVLSLEFFKEKIMYFLREFSKHIWIILFYFSLFLFSIYFEITFAYFQFIIGLIVFLLYFGFKKNDFFVEFFHINSSLFSIYYIISYLIIFFTDINFLWFIDFLNCLLIVFSFIILFIHYKNLKATKIKNYIFVHFSVYLFLSFIFYISWYFISLNILFWLSILSTLFSIFFFDIFPKISYFSINIYLSRLLSIWFLYFWILTGILYLMFSWYSSFIFICLIISYFFNLYIHYKFQNYVSFIISLFVWTFLIYYTFYPNIIYVEDISFLIFSIFFSSFLIFTTYIYKFKYIYDFYVIHTYAFLINLISVIIYFIFNDFLLLYVSLLLFVESIFFFASFNRLKNIGKK